jgi:hypothetical protein
LLSRAVHSITIGQQKLIPVILQNQITTIGEPSVGCLTPFTLA